MIDRCIICPSHGEIKIDGINVSENSYMRQKMCIIRTEESNNEIMIKNATSMICDNNEELRFNFVFEE